MSIVILVFYSDSKFFIEQLLSKVEQKHISFIDYSSLNGSHLKITLSDHLTIEEVQGIENTIANIISSSLSSPSSLSSSNHSKCYPNNSIYTSPSLLGHEEAYINVYNTIVGVRENHIRLIEEIESITISILEKSEQVFVDACTFGIALLVHSVAQQNEDTFTFSNSILRSFTPRLQHESLSNVIEQSNTNLEEIMLQQADFVDYLKQIKELIVTDTEFDNEELNYFIELIKASILKEISINTILVIFSSHLYIQNEQFVYLTKLLGTVNLPESNN